MLYFTERIQNVCGPNRSTRLGIHAFGDARGRSKSTDKRIYTHVSILICFDFHVPEKRCVYNDSVRVFFFNSVERCVHIQHVPGRGWLGSREHVFERTVTIGVRCQVARNPFHADRTQDEDWRFFFVLKLSFMFGVSRRVCSLVQFQS